MFTRSKVGGVSPLVTCMGVSQGCLLLACDKGNVLKVMLDAMGFIVIILGK